MARVLLPGGWKYASRTLQADQGVLAFVKWNPNQEFIEDGATKVTAARMQVQTSNINFDLNAVADATIGTYAGNSGGDDSIMFADAATVQVLINLINGLELGIDRYRAGLGDFRPGWPIGTGDGVPVALTNILLGRNHRGLAILADTSGLSTANQFSAGIGTQGAREGGGSEVPDNFQVEYTSTPAGVTTQVRNAALTREKVYTSQFETRIFGIHAGLADASNLKVVSVFDQNNTLLFRESITSALTLANADRYSFDNPIVSAMGPLFVEVGITGALTDGPLTVQAAIRVA